ncbi:anaerobic nitric oxide reductase flavorubredoxin [Alkalibaculum sp. M08DMB]|uniref:Anaerobic nitric oxide reductase flavorubredoxin n=1 Tax=Alkalibaculum sporogenes TaxID=2655001 RepID=A0A6A7KBU5_9FIRM|nr:anaerobic nitric oxide reductase flavorubredoxin [Alkalibaculum sporogenes]MPW26825.1 anaerobic nitric oxide reductase flavorubredoxin [Alkalibaculum sporogenes]
MDYKITDKVTWVGKIDWELRKFHGDEYSTKRGTSYNSYLIKDKKNVLIDTAWLPYDKEFVSNLKKEIDLKEIDYIVMNHNEVDHSGALIELMREIPNTPIYCTANGAKVLKGLYHEDWNFVTVKTGDTLDIGDSKLVFIEARMLHWPDTMFTYMTGDNILFSNDGFGQHFATENLYNNTVDQAELYQEALKYYTNILTPFSVLVKKKIEEILSFNYPLDMICPSHGVIWRDNPVQIVEKYLEWADNYQENQITLVYDTMWNGTRRMAETIAKGIKSVDDEVTVKLLNCAKTDKNDIMVEVFKSKAILIGSSTINKGILFSVAGNIEMIKGLGFKNKKAAGFGAYGWSGESVKIITEEIEKCGLKLVDEGIRELWNPDKDALERCFEYGKEFVEKIK